jgi:hypothetical protein
MRNMETDGMTNKQEEKKTPRGRKMLYGIALVLVLWCIVFDVFKVTDPSDPKFDPYKFKFTDYSLQELGGVFGKLFHPGVDRAFIENVLVSSGGARTYISAETVNYSWTTPFIYVKVGIPVFAYTEGSSIILVKYNQDGKAVAMQSSVNGGFNVEVINRIQEENRVRMYQQHEKEIKESEHDK